MSDLLYISGWIAGAIIAAAALPKLINRMIKFPDAEKFNIGDLFRDSMIVTGNMIWVVFGYFNYLPMIVVFCGINAALTTVLVIQNLSRYSDSQ